MRNWCANKLIIEHADPKKIREVAEAYNREELLAYFTPRPGEFFSKEISTYNRTHPEMYGILINEIVSTQTLQSKYEWCLTNWEPKQDIRTYGLTVRPYGRKLELHFDTEFSPPLDAINRAKEMGFLLEYYFYLPSMKCLGFIIEGSFSLMDSDDPEVKYHFYKHFDYSVWESECSERI